MVTGLPLTQRNLIITGYIEPNKPRIGRQIASELRMPFVDVEEQMRQRYGDDIEGLRQQYGERHLKTLQDEMMAEISLHRNSVIRVNGTVLVSGDHFEVLQRTGPIVCLVARLDAVLQRLHLTLGARYHDPGERQRQIGRLRREWAVRQKDGLYEIDATYMDEAAIAAAVCELWQQVAIERV